MLREHGQHKRIIGGYEYDELYAALGSGLVFMGELISVEASTIPIESCPDY